MGRPAAKAGDVIAATDTHIVLVQIGTGQLPVPLFHVFNGKLADGLSGDVRIMGRPAATVGSVAVNTIAHVPTAPGVAFQRAPSNRGRVSRGSGTVRVNGKAIARSGDLAETCNDPQDAPVGRVLAAGSVFVG
jgi:uncharacterized Zn-binding protein involved in type VI secretion